MTLSFAAWMKDATVRIEARQTERIAAERARLAARTPEQVTRDEAIKAIVDRMPPFTAEQRERLEQLRPVLAGSLSSPRPERKPTPPRRTGRALDPPAGILYGEHLRATPGSCQRCRKDGSREVDHCHEHHVVRGLICRPCNKLSEKSLGDDWRRNCLWCAWDLWLAEELAR